VHPKIVRRRRLAACAAALVLGAWGEAAAQETRTVVAGARYDAGGLHRLLLGDAYRAAWTTPVRVQVLDPARFAGGLTVLQAGGGLSTESLRLKGRDGREYTFRSVDKDATRAVPEDLQGTIVQDIAQDQTAAKQPAAALVVPVILRAAGVLHVVPRLYVMPDHPFLGEHRRDFAGRLGQLEERPTDEGPGFAGADKVDGTEDFLEELEEKSDNRVDARAFLTARLVDMMMGDWDRHPDQWRWARYDRGGVETWRPIPRDRDNAFARHEGVMMAGARSFAPQLTRFRGTYGDIYGLHFQASELDRQLLSELDRRSWDSVANFLRTRITDAVIDSAVRRLPPEYYAVDGPRLRTELTERRDGLTRAAADFYALISREVDVHASDEDEFAGITRAPDGSVTVTLVPARRGDPARGGRPSFTRRFVPGETREVRVFLRGGDDFAQLSGAGRGGIKVRVIGGGGDDRMEDRSTGARGGALFYDDRGDNRLSAANGARIDTREYEEVERRSLAGNPPPPRDYGSTASVLTPTARWVSNVGPVLGFGPSWTRYGFRRQPYARFAHARFVYAPLASGIGAEVVADIRRTNRPAFTTVAVRGSNFETTRFHGFGNSTTESGEDRELYIVRHDFLGAEVLLNTRLADGLTLSAGPEVRFLDARVRSGSVIGLTRPPGTSAFTQFGGVARLHFERRDTLAVTRRGMVATAAARGFGWDDGTPFARLSASAATYIPVGAVGPTVALRAGAERAIGDFPFQEAAYLGGSTSVRGYPTQRFAGDGAAFGSAELRQPVGQVKLGVRGRLSVLALADAGRVYFDGESGSDWHAAFGGGAYFETIGRIVSVTVARGESTLVYLHFGLPF
jgi:hypothetical protein